MCGIWKNFDEMEENITLPELEKILDAMREKDRNDKKFLAAIQGIDLSKNEVDDKFEEVRRRAEAKAKGVSEDALLFGDMGIEVIEEE